jgi:hypothetical protein
MADIADDASCLQEQELNFAFHSRTRATLPATGECHFCEEPVEGEKLFCDHHCAKDWERLQQAAARSGTAAAVRAATHRARG